MGTHGKEHHGFLRMLFKIGLKSVSKFRRSPLKFLGRAEVEKLGDRLPDTINGQILKKAKGKTTLAKDSPEMKALEAYIRHKHSV
jgi:hypothetical protein